MSDESHERLDELDASEFDGTETVKVNAPRAGTAGFAFKSRLSQLKQWITEGAASAEDITAAIEEYFTETGDPQILTLGDIPDGKLVRRVGNALVGVDDPAGGATGFAHRALVDPTQYAWDWENQGEAIHTEYDAALGLFVPAGASRSFKLRKKAVRAKPYAEIAHFRYSMVHDNTPGGIVFGFLDDVANTFAGFVHYPTLGWYSALSANGAFTITDNYAQFGGNWQSQDLMNWIRLYDSPTVRTISFSATGLEGDWHLLHSQATNTNVTPSHVHYGLMSPLTNSSAGLIIDSWEEA